MPAHAVIALVDDLMTVSRLESAARGSNRNIALPTSESEVKQAIESAAGGSALLLVGLSTTHLPWETLVPLCQSVASAEGVTLRVVAFGPHMDLKLRQHALETGI